MTVPTDALQAITRHGNCYSNEARDMAAELLATRKGCSTAWLIERAGGIATMYRTADRYGFGWTTDVNCAIRFARRADAEMCAASDELAHKIVEHTWTGL